MRSYLISVFSARKANNFLKIGCREQWVPLLAEYCFHIHCIGQSRMIFHTKNDVDLCVRECPVQHNI